VRLLPTASIRLKRALTLHDVLSALDNHDKAAKELSILAESSRSGAAAGPGPQGAHRGVGAGSSLCYIPRSLPSRHSLRFGSFPHFSTTVEKTVEKLDQRLRSAECALFFGRSSHGEGPQGRNLRPRRDHVT
jgi:hypothetical protein